MPRSPLLHGLGLTLRNPRPLLWMYVFNAGLAWLAGFALRAQYSEVMANSLAAQRMIGGFDLGTAVEALRRVGEGPSGPMAASALGVPVYLVVFFLLVPGTLLAYQTETPLGLGGLLQRGVQAFWSFVRIMLIALVVSVPVLGLLGFLRNRWNGYLDRSVLGEPGFVLQMTGLAVVLLVAALLRLYFDLVEVHTVALSRTLRPNGRPDRRVRKTLRPAMRTLRGHLVSSYFTFVFLAVLGAVAMYFFGLSALHHLGQPRSWPTLLLAQAGLFVMLFTRFWQRGAETVMFQNVFPEQARSTVFAARGVAEEPFVRAAHVEDPVPDPEPIAPSLDGPDPGVFHHEVPPKGDLVD